MHIQKEHLYHGAALIQIAEDPRFTAINSLTFGRKTSKSAYRINSNVAVYLKYAGEPNESHDEYVFQFSTEQRAEMEAIAKHVDRFLVALVCVQGREICCVEYAEILEMFRARRKAKRGDEDQITVLVTMPPRKEFRVYVNAPGRKNKLLGQRLVPRNAFPQLVFLGD